MKLGNKLSALLLILAALALVNFIGAKLPFRWDTTSEALYTLSAGSQKLVSKIEDPIRLDFYFSRSSEAIPVLYKNYATRVQEMLRQYVRASSGRLTLQVIDPRPDTPEEEKASAAGLTPQMLQTGEKIWFGLVATQADQQKAIAAFTPQREAFLEYDLSQLLFTVQQTAKRRLGLLTSLPLQASGPANPMMRRQASPGQYVATEWERLFEIVTIDASATELPANLDALAVIHPQRLSPKTEYAIDQFLLSGKPVLVAVDPASQHFKQQSQGAMFGGPQPGVSSDFAPLKAYGVAYNPQVIVGDPRNAAEVQAQNGIVRYPLWLNLRRDAFTSDSAATSQLNSMLLVEPGSLARIEMEGLTFTPLIQTSPEAGELPAMAAQFAQPETIARELKSTGQRTLAALVRGTFKSAFPNGAPETPASSPSSTSSTSSASSSTLLIIADTDWLFDAYSLRRLGAYAMPFNDNLSFGSNVVEILAGSPDLITLRSKGSSLRPFTVVEDMERAANAKYQARLQSLDDKLAEIQKQLSELQQKRTNSPKLVATPEIKKAVADFQKQEAAVNAERRAIRKVLREDIEALGNRLLLINLFAAPVLVIAGGLWYQRRRRAA
ncbi:Gldg family protein [Nibricoccus sp. IMCC34717]|uniref:Gldg family protein n=1 Tax=Nibricoccus sp. IMCC34717 TaxID=3034021 RepID=UPI00384E9F63